MPCSADTGNTSAMPSPKNSLARPSRTCESILLTASETGLPSRLSIWERSRSLPVISARPSTRKMMWSAVFKTNSAWRRICPGMYSWSCTTMPPVSISSKRRPSCSAVPCIRSRVMPGSSPTMARRCPVMRLKRVDFPTLGLPTMTTVGMALDMIFHDSRRGPRGYGATIEGGARLESGQIVGFFFCAQYPSVCSTLGQEAAPMTTPKSLDLLEQQRVNVTNQIAALVDLLCGSITSPSGRCGKPNCHCHQPKDPGHGPNLRLTFKINGKTVTEFLPDQPATRKAEREIAEFRKLQDLHKELIEVNAQICQLRPSEPDVLSPEEKKRLKRSKRKSRAK